MMPSVAHGPGCAPGYVSPAACAFCVQEKTLGGGGGALMTHGNSDVMEARPRADPSANVCGARCVRDRIIKKEQ